jgi:hypothetical protein
MTKSTFVAESPPFEQCGKPGAMMQIAMQPALRTTGSRHLLSLDGYLPNLTLRRRRDFGSLHHGDARRGDGFPHPIYRRHGHYESARPPISCGYVRDQCLGIFFDWSVDDTTHREASTTSKLAVPAGGGFPRRVHDVLQLRMGDAELGQRRWPLARSVQCGRKCPARICSRLAGVDHRGKALIEST